MNSESQEKKFWIGDKKLQLPFLFFYPMAETSFYAFHYTTVNLQ